MKLRLLAAVVLLLVAIGLPVAAVSSKGAPWGFRGHQAVVLEVAGNVEGQASELRRERERRIDDKLDVAPNVRLDTGDELRVSRLSEARLRFEAGEVTVGDGARVTIGDGKITLARGLLRVRLDAGKRRFDVALENGAAITVRSAEQAATATVVADGKGGVRAIVVDGFLDARTREGESLAEAGRVLIIEGDKARVVDAPAALAVSVTCTAKKANIVAPPQAQVFAGGTLVYPDVVAGAESGSVSVDVDAAEVVVFARDVAGNFARTTARCEAPPKKK